MGTDVFLSVGRTFTDEQEAVVRTLEQLLRNRGLNPRTVGRNDFTSRTPLLRIKEVMGECQGVVVLALERTRAEKVMDRPGGVGEAISTTVRMPTIWNQIEATMGYARGLPLLVVVERGLKAEGLLEKGYDWYIQSIDLDSATLRTDEFLGVLDDWIKHVNEPHGTALATSDSRRSASEYTLSQIASSLTVPQLWTALGSIASALAVVATVAYKIGGA
jgi:hypothetical protein